MAHTIHNQKKLLARVRRIRGQAEGLERSLEGQRDCLDILHKHITQDKYITSVDWKEGTFAIWDNRGVQHRAVDNYQGERRDMFRVILER